MINQLTVIGEEIAEMLNRDEEEARRPFHISNFLKSNGLPKHHLMFSSVLIEIFFDDLKHDFCFRKRESWSYYLRENS